MVRDVRKMLEEFTGGLKELSNTHAKQVSAFMNLLGEVYQPGALDEKTKELISVAISVYNRCQYCIVFHTYKAFEAGATQQEILEAAMVSVAFGGGPSMAYSVTILKDCLVEFENDFR